VSVLAPRRHDLIRQSRELECCKIYISYTYIQMLGRNHTNEFSIILHLDKQSSDDIEQIRAVLPDSPYRDDKPHITLAADILTSRPMADQELLVALEPLLQKILRIRPHALVRRISNKAGGHYTSSSAIELSSSAELQAEHSILLKALTDAGFRLGRNAKFYKPHITIRLGVTLSDEAQEKAERLFPKGREVDVGGWAILRLATKRIARPSYELDP